jgi:hypothetical protein
VEPPSVQLSGDSDTKASETGFSLESGDDAAKQADANAKQAADKQDRRRVKKGERKKKKEKAACRSAEIEKQKQYAERSKKTPKSQRHHALPLT